MIFPLHWKYPYAQSKQSRLYKDYDGLAASLLLNQGSGKGRVIQITSAWDGEGKTYTALNLAAHLALRGKKVLLIDTDPERRTLGELFGFNSSPGLMAGLSSNGDDLPVRSAPGVANLSLLGFGDDTNVDVLELLRDQLESFLSRVAGQYDFVLLDSAPVIASDEAKVMIKAVQQVLLVVRGHKTSSSDIDGAREAIQNHGGELLGVVMNAYHEYLPRAFQAWL